MESGYFACFSIVSISMTDIFFLSETIFPELWLFDRREIFLFLAAEYYAHLYSSLTTRNLGADCF